MITKKKKQELTKKFFNEQKQLKALVVDLRASLERQKGENEEKKQVLLSSHHSETLGYKEQIEVLRSQIDHSKILIEEAKQEATDKSAKEIQELRSSSLN